MCLEARVHWADHRSEGASAGPQRESVDAPASQAGEPCLLKSLRHPSVVKLLFAVKSITGQAFLVMEFMLSDLTREIQKTLARTPSGAAFRSPSLGSIRRICGASTAEISTRSPHLRGEDRG